MGTQSEPLTLRWPELASELVNLPDVDAVRSMIQKYGETRLLYAAMLADDIQFFDDAVDRYYFIEQTLRENWLTDATQARLAQFRNPYIKAPKRLSIPWRDRYLLPDHVEDMERLAAWNSMEQGMPRTCIADEYPVDPKRVRPYLDSSGNVIPDLQPENLIIWLHFLMEGHRDPRLAKAFARHRPDLHLSDYERCKSAWVSLGFSFDNSLGDSKS